MSLTVWIEPRPGSFAQEVYVVDEMGQDQIKFAHMQDGDMLWTVLQLEPGHAIPSDKIKPLLRLPWPVAQEVFAQLAEKLPGKGYQPSSVARVEGELYATKSHLADMRRLVFDQEAKP